MSGGSYSPGGGHGTAPMQNAIGANQGWNSGPGYAGGGSAFTPAGGARAMGGTGAPQEPMQNPGALTPAGQQGNGPYGPLTPPPAGLVPAGGVRPPEPLQSPGAITPARPQGQNWAGGGWQGPQSGGWWGGGQMQQAPMYSGLGAGQFNFPNMAGWRMPTNLNFGGGGSMK